MYTYKWLCIAEIKYLCTLDFTIDIKQLYVTYPTGQVSYF